MLVDAGPAPGGPASTVVDVTGRALVLLRAGAVPWEAIERCALPDQEDRR
jgi:tRNA A37 threonylcarbamoyladenosine synthetase subunit TsaC/SUA5/YrdC